MLVTVPEADALIGKWRLEHTDDAPAGIPAHVTILFPFVPAARLAEVEERAAAIVSATLAFDVAFRRTARFPELLYLDPEPAEPFLALTAGFVDVWPQHPPYEGEHETVVPHLTVAGAADDVLDAIASELEPRLPLRKRVEAASLFVENEDGRWHEHRRLPLGEPA